MKKKVPINEQKGLLTQKTSVDLDFEFKKLGTPILKIERINPHKLLQIYFNYYGLVKVCLCNQTKSVTFNRLIDNFESSYKKF